MYTPVSWNSFSKKSGSHSLSNSSWYSCSLITFLKFWIFASCSSTFLFYSCTRSPSCFTFPSKTFKFYAFEDCCLPSYAIWCWLLEYFLSQAARYLTGAAGFWVYTSANPRAMTFPMASCCRYCRRSLFIIETSYLKI